jgi:hypothetical protein
VRIDLQAITREARSVEQEPEYEDGGNNDGDSAPGAFFYYGYMLWEKDGSSFEIRTQGEVPDGRPALDEIVAEKANIHLEQMSHDQWWMGIEAGGKYFHLNFDVKDGRLCVHLSDQGDEYAEWEGDNREKPLTGADDSI